MSNIEYLTQLKKELEKASNNVEKIKILKNNIPEDTIYTYMKKCNQGNEEKIALHFGKNKKKANPHGKAPGVWDVPAGISNVRQW